MMMKKNVRVLICDDSALIRQMLVSIFDSDPTIEIVGVASNAAAARKMIKELNPDVLTLDIEMPGMDGLSFLEKIMTLRPMPVVMISSLTTEGSAQTLRALELGGVDVIAKPTVNVQERFNELAYQICATIHSAANAQVKAIGPALKRSNIERTTPPMVDLIAIGASTGGVQAIKQILPLLPETTPPVVITQHMPAGYTQAFANRMNMLSRLEISEAKNGVILKPGTALIAPGNFHLRVRKRLGRLESVLGSDDLVSGHRPSVDALFDSVAELGLKNAVGIILTGMGRDGARGMMAMRRAGAHTVAQDEVTSIVYGMPRVAFETGAAEVSLPLNRMAAYIEQLCWPETAIKS